MLLSMISKRIYIAVAFICVFVTQVAAQVVVTSGGTVNMCVGGAYVNIPAFKVAEKQNTDFAASGSLQTYELSAPSDFEFNPGVGSVAIPASTDISYATLNVTATKITLLYFLNTTAKKDSFIFNGLQVRGVTTTSSNDLRFTGGNASQNQNNQNQYVHAHFNSASANVNINMSATSVCSNGSDINLNGSPGGGSYTVSPSSSGLTGSTFKPSVAGPGSYYIIYTATNNGCTGKDSVHITVNSIPAVTFFGLANSYCSADSTNYQLTGFPTGGTFTGSGTSGSNGSTFKPYTLGPGTNIPIKYTYTDANNCQNFTQFLTNILQSPSVSIVLDPNNASCSINDPNIQIKGDQSNPSTGGTITLSGDGVNNSTGYFIPSAAGVGDHIIYRTIKAPNQCVATAQRKISVNNSTSDYIIGLNDKYCNYNSPVTLTSAFPNAIFSGPGIVSNDPATNSAVFDPSQVGDFPGQQFTFDITVEILGGLAIYSKPTTVYKKPIIIIAQDTSRNSINFRTKFCNQDAAVPLSVYVYPTGGIGSFSGSGLDGVKFNPSLVNSNPNESIDTVTVSYTYTDVNGCQNIDIDTVLIFSTTTDLDFGTLNANYCSNSDTVTLAATQGGVSFPGGSFSGTGIKGNNFIPSLAASYNTGLSNTYVIQYIYGNTSGCLTTVSKNVIINKVPEVNLNNLNTAYCLSKDTVALSGSPGSNSGTFSISALAPATTQPGMFYNNNRFLISTATAGTYYLTYTYTDPTTHCTSFDTDTTIIRNVPNTTFTNLDAAYCMSNANITLYGSPSGDGGVYSSPTASLTKGVFKIQPSGVGKHAITYTYTDEFSCSASFTQNTIVYGIPLSVDGKKPQFKLSTLCENDFITLSDLSSQVETTNGAVSSIQSCYWKIDNTIYTSTFEHDTTLQLLAGQHVLTYKLTTDKGCTNATTDTTITIGSYPQTAFTWDKICNKENTKFYNTTSSSIVGNVNSIIWDFGDGSPNITVATSQTVKGDTSHTFATASNELTSVYSVMLTASTNYNCITTDTQKVFILPARDISSLSPYSNDFNDQVGDWIASTAIDSIQPSWALGVPNKKNIKSDNAAWVTSLKNSFNKNEASYVYSPCFTVDNSITKPMIHMDIWSATNKNISGANLEYSANGTSWNTLGKPNESGINWYNNETNISSRPSGAASLDQNGWTGMDVAWKNARHIFDKELGNSKNIRFRISFAGGIDTTDGFAFDNVWIGDRTRLILAEHFTNNSSMYTQDEDTTLNNLITSDLLNNEPKDIVSLQYHTAFPGPDQMNARNIPDAGARALYYGVTQVPYTCLDGSYFNGSALKIDTNMVNTRSLYDPAFNITLAPLLTSGNVSGSLSIENKIPVTNSVTVYISLLERFVNNIPGANGENNYQWVHAKFLPDAAGTSFAANWSSQSTQTINYNWDFTSANIYNPDKMAMIVFVQDNVTKEIYQTAYAGLGASVATAVFNPAETSSTVSLYPNPANDATTVILNGKLSGDYNWIITDELGRTIDQGKLKSETDAFTINTINYAGGFYTLRLSNVTDGIKTQKFVVVH